MLVPRSYSIKRLTLHSSRPPTAAAEFVRQDEIYIPIIEDDVKASMADFLRSKGYLSVDAKMGTGQGYDVEGRHPVSGKRLVVECKGQAQTGRSWDNVASAILTSLNESQDSIITNDAGIAFPDTPEYKYRMKLLQQFFKNENITVFWVSELGTVEQWYVNTHAT